MSTDDGAGFLGTGWAFPPTFGVGGGTVAMVSDEEDIHQSLHILFATRPGERPMHEDYGCALDDLMFETIDHDLIGRTARLVEGAVRRHEPRIEVLGVDVGTGDDARAGVLLVRLDYRVRATHTRFNMVFPYDVADPVRGGA